MQPFSSFGRELFVVQLASIYIHIPRGREGERLRGGENVPSHRCVHLLSPSQEKYKVIYNHTRPYIVGCISRDGRERAAVVVCASRSVHEGFPSLRIPKPVLSQRFSNFGVRLFQIFTCFGGTSVRSLLFEVNILNTRWSLLSRFSPFFQHEYSSSSFTPLGSFRIFVRGCLCATSREVRTRVLAVSIFVFLRST